jgi:hypothetical protein
MLSAKHPPARNLLDLADAKQVRTLTRRLKLSADELNQIIQKSGTSIAAITKEAELQRTKLVPTMGAHHKFSMPGRPNPDTHHASRPPQSYRDIRTYRDIRIYGGTLK